MKNNLPITNGKIATLCIENMATVILLGILLSLPASASATSDFGYHNLKELIQNENLNSVEEVIPRLPVAMRSNFTLMKESLSLQEGSPQFPRAILFTDNGSLTCTFNGSPKEAGFYTLECMEFNFKAKAFEFHQIEFPNPGNTISKPVFSPLNMTANKEISCTMCHGSDPRPNWETYSKWPGAYGSEDDYFDYTFARTLPKSNPDSYAGQQPELKKEQIDFINFQNHVPKSARYSALIFPEGSKYSPYLDGTHSKGDRKFRPNLRFSEIVKILNAQRDARLLSRFPRSRSYAFIMAVANCPEDQNQYQFPLFFQKTGTGSSLSFNEYTPPKETEFVRTYRAVLADIISPSEWSPVFRGMDPECKGCYFNKGGGKNPPVMKPQDQFKTYDGSYPWTYDYTSGDSNTMNQYVATEIIKFLISTGDEDLKPYFFTKSNLLDVYYSPMSLITKKRTKALDSIGMSVDRFKLWDGCSLLEQKLNKSLSSGQSL